MKFFSKCKDGGSQSPVDAYFLFEIKGLFSVALLKFNEGGREAYHSHAFNALTWFLKGDLTEERVVVGVEGLIKQETHYKRSLFPKFTSKENLHRVRAKKTSWCITLRGKWEDTWYEYEENPRKLRVLTHGRLILREMTTEGEANG